MTGAFELPRLPGLLDIATAVRSPDGEHAMLGGLAETAAGALGFSIVINLHRPAWDDFEVAVVTGSDAASARLLGQRTSWDEWRGVLVERFRRGAAYFVPAGEFDWSGDTSRHVPDRDYGAEAEAWQTGDELFLPLHGSDGEVLGVLSLDEPASGQRPSETVLASLEAAGAHIAMALELARLATSASRDRSALGHLMRISTRLGRGGVDETLESVCEGIRDALGFRVVGAILRRGIEFEMRASVGLPPEKVDELRHIPAEAVEPIFDATDTLREGSVLITRAEADAQGLIGWPYQSTRNGAGPQAWRRHVLCVPLVDGAGVLQGAVWADDPEDRLLPSAGALRSLRTFANQATTALEAGRQLRALAHTAEHDPLTGLRNRRGLLDEIDRHLAASEHLVLLMCDMDDFKRVNDRLGYAAGDDAIRAVAGILAAEVERGGVAARLGGEEFALVLPGASEADGREVATRVRAAVAAAFADQAWPQTLSVGLAATCPGHTVDSAAALLRLAGRALLAAKRLGRDRYIVHDDLFVEGVLRGMEQAGTDTEATALLVRLAESLDMREAGTGRHSQIVASLTRATAAQLGWSDERVERMRLAGLVHDIGKLVVPSEILQKPASLTEEEWVEIARHPETGARMLEHAAMPDVAAWVRAHHERLDGGGYPSGLAGDQIPFEARIVAAADAYEAMTSPRPYAEPRPHDVAAAEMRRCAGAQFDPAVVEVLLEVVDRDPLPRATRRDGPARPRPADRRATSRTAS